jgi:hypothetical protein
VPVPKFKCKVRLAVQLPDCRGDHFLYRIPMTHVNPLAHKFFTQKMISRSIYNLKIDTIGMCDIPFDRSILQLSNGIRHVMPSTDKKLELTAKASMAQPVSQLAACSNALRWRELPSAHVTCVQREASATP